MSTTKTIDITKPFLGIHAGLVAIRGVARTADAILAAGARLTEVSSKVSPPSDGTTQTGRFSGLRIMEFQDRLYGHNMLPGWGFTDAELAAAWKAEFPTAKCDFAAKNAYVTSARGDLNRGRRGLTIAQLNAQYGFTGPVLAFTKPIEEVKPVEVKVAVAVAKVAGPSKSQAKKVAKAAKRAGK